MRLRVPFLFALLLAGAAVSLACGGDDDDGSSAPAAAPAAAAAAATTAASTGAGIGVELTEWAVTAASASVSAGEVTFTVQNGGAQTHEFVVIRTDLDAAALPTAAGSVDESAVEVIDRIESFSGGQTIRLTVTLEAGSYALICNLPAHYGLGMSTAFAVE